MRPVALVPLALLGLSAPALAGEAVVLPPGEVAGGEVATLALVAVDAAGRPIAGLRWKASASIGAVSSCAEAAPGAYTCSFVAPAVPSRTASLVELRAKTPERELLTAAVTVDLVPAARRELSIVANPTELILGDGEGGTVTLEVPGGAPPSLDASAGTLDTVTALGEGRFTARYAARAVNFPHVALVGAADPVTGAVAYAPIRLSGKADFPVQAAEGATVILRVDGREFGPVRADAGGVAAVPVIVPPGVSVGTQVVVRDGEVQESEIDLAIPSSRRLHVLPIPAAVPAGVPIPVRVAVTTPQGAPDDAAPVELSATSGEVGGVQRVGPGLYEASWTPAAGAEALVSVLGTLPAERKQAHSVEARVLPARPATIEVAHDPLTGSGEVVVEAIARDADENGVGGLTVTVLGGETTTLRDLGVGRYRGSVAFSPATREQLVVVGGEPTGLPPARLVLLAPRRAVAPGASVPVAVFAVDRLGVPVPGVEVELSVSHGTGRIDRAVALGEVGAAVVRYRAADAVEGVRVVARAGAASGALTLATVPGGAAVVPELAGDAAIDALRATSGWIGDALASAAPSVAVAPEPVAPEPVAPVAPVAPAAPQVTAEWEAVARVRAGGVFSSYAYAQEPIGDGGPLLDEKLVVGGPQGDGAARPIGWDVGARAFGGGGARFVGVDAAVATTYYGLTTEAFDGAVARDALQVFRAAAVGRVPVRLADEVVLHGGLRVGAELSDFMYFTGDVQARYVEYATLLVPSLSLGGEVAVEAGRVFAVAHLDGLLAYVSRPMGTRFGLQAGVDLADNVFVTAQLGRAGRVITVVGTESGVDLGTLTDAQWHGGVGMGFRL